MFCHDLALPYHFLQGSVPTGHESHTAAPKTVCNISSTEGRGELLVLALSWDRGQEHGCIDREHCRLCEVGGLDHNLIRVLPPWAGHFSCFTGC